MTQGQARELALRLMRAKGVERLAGVTTTDQGKLLTGGLVKAFTNRGIVIDMECAEGIADAVLDVCPGLRDEPSARRGLVHH